MPHCLPLPQRLFIVKTHEGIILFVIVFRIVDADSSNCDFTIRFLIRVHGLPPGSFNPSSVIVLVRNLETGQSFERANQPTNERTHVGTNERTCQRTNQRTNQPTIQLTIQPAKQSTNQTTNKNKNKSTRNNQRYFLAVIRTSRDWKCLYLKAMKDNQT